MTDALLDEMDRKGVYWVPDDYGRGRMWHRGAVGNGREDGGFGKDAFQKALKKRVQTALGTDAGGGVGGLLTGKELF